jgi:hypothetical protein
VIPPHKASVAGVRGDEERVVTAYTDWLQQDGWAVTRGAGYAGVYAEAKGRTADAGTDADILYGQLLRRMSDPAGTVRYAVVVPTTALRAALRVPAWVRERLRIDVYEVGDAGAVHLR